MLRQRGQSAIKVIDFGSSCYEHQKGISANILSTLDIYPSSDRQLCLCFKTSLRIKPAEHIFLIGFVRNLVLKLRQNATRLQPILMVSFSVIDTHSSVQKF